MRFLVVLVMLVPVLILTTAEDKEKADDKVVDHITSGQANPVHEKHSGPRTGLACPDVIWSTTPSGVQFWVLKSNCLIFLMNSRVLIRP
ncbi:unnamed protein product [Heligmosomoides polygyrus]|uniref:C-type lectin domain-containing protein n=1 Tax=Heligmosomoides polygyrus TaxID=6339 RepID=A0A183G3C1_HELPZ|nr:unnamed protein product [Heligmosomoides polygyrus]